MTTAVPPVDQVEKGKVFLWAKERRIWIHLIAFLLFSVIIHGSGFYLFKVVYPSPVRVERSPGAITVLDTADPAVRSVLQRISDRTIFLLPPSAQSGVRIGLEKRRVPFTPAFQRTELELKAPLSDAAMPGFIHPLDSKTPAGEPLPSDKRFKVKLAPSLTARAFAPWSIMDDYLRTADSLPLLKIHIEIAADGKVRVIRVDAPLEETEKADFARVIESTLRFVPATNVETGWIEIGGEESEVLR